jgi:tetratricopeptide (TPR) repeat protein
MTRKRIAAGIGALTLAATASCSFFIHGSSAAGETTERAIRESAAAGLSVSGRMSDVTEFSASRATRGEAPPERLRLTDARRSLERAVADAPSPEGHRALGRAYLAEGKPVEAFMQLQLAVQQFPNDAKLRNDLGLCCLEAGRDNPDALAEAMQHFDHAQKLDPNVIEIFYNRARYFEMTNQTSKAVEAWEAYLQRDAASPWAKQARERIEFLKTVTASPAR